MHSTPAFDYSTTGIPAGPHSAAIDSLPNELLCVIFEQAVITLESVPSETYKDVSYVPIPRSDCSVLKAISHVSNRWHEIVQADQLLWASALNIDFSGLSKAQAISERAGAMPLAIHCHNNHWEHDFEADAWHHVFNLQSTWEYLSITMNAYSDKAQLAVALAKPAPQLGTLRLHNDCLRRSDEMSDLDPEYFVLPENLFGGYAPSLRKVSLANVFFPPALNSSVWKQITVLHVRQLIDDDEWYEPYAYRWLEILGAMPQLETLIVSWVPGIFELLEAWPDSTWNSPVLDVHMNHLEKLEFATWGDTEAGFIGLYLTEMITVPNACHTTLILTADSVSVPMIETVIDRRVRDWDSAGATLTTEIWRKPDRKLEFGFEISARSIHGATLDVRFAAVEDDDAFAIVRASEYAEIEAYLDKIPRWSS